MKSILESLAERGEWQDLQMAIEESFTYEDVVQKQIENMEKFLSEIQMPEGWKAEFYDSHEAANEDVFIDILVLNENNEWAFYFTFDLDAYEHRSYFELFQFLFYVDAYIATVEGDAIEETDFSKLLARYDELAKIFREVKKIKREVK